MAKTPSNKPLPKYVRTFRREASVKDKANGRRQGRRRWVFKRNGFSIELPAPWATNWQACYDAAIARSADKKTPEKRDSNIRMHSVEWLLSQYRQTEDFTTNIKDSTRQDKEALMKRIAALWGEADIRSLTARGLGHELERTITSPQVRNRVRGMFSQILGLAVWQGHIPSNPVKDIPRWKTTTIGTHGWTPDQQARFLDCYGPGTVPRLAFLLLFETVQRSSDVVLMGRDHIDGGEITGRQLKTGTTYRVPISSELQVELDNHRGETPIRDHDRFLLTAYGVPWSAKGFQQAFGRWADAAGLPKECRGHGLRVAGCHELAESGCSSAEFMAISGHKTLAEAEKYIREANKRKLAKVAAAKRKSSREE